MSGSVGKGVDRVMDQWERVNERREVEGDLKKIFLKMTRLPKSGKTGGRGKTKKTGGKKK